MLALSFAPIITMGLEGKVDEVLRWTQTIIELANRDRTMGYLIIGSPVAVALAMRGVARLSVQGGGTTLIRPLS
jgi:hypothetical protein